MNDRQAKAMHCAIADVMDGRVLDPVCLEPILALIALNKARYAVGMAEHRLEKAFKRAGLSSARTPAKP